jgi:hypothetical protein
MMKSGYRRRMNFRASEYLKSERAQRFLDIIGHSENWKAYGPENQLPGEDPPEPPTEPEIGKLAIQETLVRSILARNLQRIEPGLKQHPDFRLEEVTFELGRLDLLCVDAKDRLTIIELQLGFLDDGHIGKVCRYFGWFAEKYGGDVRAMLLFENAPAELLDAYKRAVPWLELKKFALSADIKMEAN